MTLLGRGVCVVHGQPRVALHLRGGPLGSPCGSKWETEAPWATSWLGSSPSKGTNPRGKGQRSWASLSFPPGPKEKTRSEVGARRRSAHQDHLVGGIPAPWERQCTNKA